MADMVRLEQVDEVASTSEALKVRAERGAGEMALLAARQTAGRGRLGRVWASPVGNLYLSVLLRPNGVVRPGHWSLLAAVALAGSIAVPGPGRLRVKWPNDLMLDGGKLAGILLEMGGTPPWLVMGFGVNLVAAPTGLGRAVACLADHAPAPAPDVLARALLDQLQAWRRRYEAEGFAPIREAWLGLGPAVGEAIAVGAGAGRIEGRFGGIGAGGELLLDDGGRVQSVVAGEVQ